MWRTNSLEKTLMLGKIEGRREEEDRGWDSWMASPTQWTWVWASSWSWWWTEKSGLLKSLGLQRVGHDWATELNWTELDFSPPGSSVHGISQQNYWSKLSFFPPGDLPNPGVKPASCISCIDRQFLYHSATLARTKSSATVSVIGN